MIHLKSSDFSKTNSLYKVKVKCQERKIIDNYAQKAFAWIDDLCSLLWSVIVRISVTGTSYRIFRSIGRGGFLARGPTSTQEWLICDI